MIRYYKTVNHILTETNGPEAGCWMQLSNPSEEEKNYLLKKLGVYPEYLESCLDPKERSHFEKYEDQALLVLDIPAERFTNSVKATHRSHFYTMPLSFIFISNMTITVTQSPSPLIDDIIREPRGQEDLDTNHPLQLAFALAYQVAGHFVLKLGEIDEVAYEVQAQMYKSMKNDKLMQLLNLQKSLVQFSTSLRSTESTLEKLVQNRNVQFTEIEQDLLEDTIIELKQSIETADVYAQVLSSTMDAVSSMISNNMNIVMKVLTSLTIVLSIPTMIFGFYGMNVILPHDNPTFLIPVFVTFLITALSAAVLYINGFFD